MYGMYQRILVPIDGSAPSARGLDEALKLARTQGGHIRLVHVLNAAPLASPGITGARFDALFEQVREDGRLLLASAEATARRCGVAVDTKLIESTNRTPGECVAEEAESWPADVIVCGTHGRRGLARTIMGSDAEQILRQSPVPVLLVPKRTVAPAVPTPAAAPQS